MTQTPPHGGQFGPSGTDNFFTGLRRIDLRRSDDSWLGGVCSGLAERLGVDALVIRALFVVLSLGMGLGVVLYLLSWLVIPNRHEETHIESALRDGKAESVVLLVAAVLSVFGSFGWFGGGWWDGGFAGWGVISLVILGLGVWWLWTEWTKREQPGFYGQRAQQFAQSAAPGESGSAAGHAPPPYAATSAGTSAAPGHPGGNEGWSHSDSSGGTGGATAWTPSGAASTTDPTHVGVTTTDPALGHGGWGGPPRAARPAAPKPPPAPRRPGRRSAGVAGTLLGTGLALSAGGGLAWAASEYNWSVNPWLVGLAGALGALGLVILLLGLVGRTSGFPGFLAICALVLTVVALPIGNYFVPSGRVGDVTWTPDATIDNQGPFRLGAGTGILDLRDVDPQDFPDPILASVALGNLTILVPDDLTVRIEAGTGAGSVDVNDGRSMDGIGVDEVIVVGDGPIDLEVEANVGLGQVLVEGDGQ